MTKKQQIAFGLSILFLPPIYLFAANEATMTSEERAERAAQTAIRHLKTERLVECQMAVMRQMHNPDSYDHHAEIYEGDDVIMRFSGTNAFGGVVRNYARCQFEPSKADEPFVIMYNSSKEAY